MPVCMLRPFRADLSQPAPPRHVDVCQTQRYERLGGVLGQATVADLVKPPQAFDHSADVLHSGADSGLVSVFAAIHLVDGTALAHPFLVGEVLGLRRLGHDQLLLTGVGTFAIHALLLAMQQVRQRMLVVHVCFCHHRAVGEPRLVVHTDVQLHAKYHCWFLRLWCISGSRALSAFSVELGGGEDRCVHDGARAPVQAQRLQHLTDLGKQSLTELVVFKQAAKLQQWRAVGESMLHKIHAQHALHTDGRMFRDKSCAR